MGNEHKDYLVCLCAQMPSVWCQFPMRCATPVLCLGQMGRPRRGCPGLQWVGTSGVPGYTQCPVQKCWVRMCVTTCILKEDSPCARDKAPP